MAAGTTKGQRTCIGCGSQGRKGGLLRIVRDADGTASFDATGRAPGRGAYVCSLECFAAACKARKLDRALRCRLDGQDYERIAGEMTASGVRCTKED